MNSSGYYRTSNDYYKDLKGVLPLVTSYGALMMGTVKSSDIGR